MEKIKMNNSRTDMKTTKKDIKRIVKKALNSEFIKKEIQILSKR